MKRRTTVLRTKALQIEVYRTVRKSAREEVQRTNKRILKSFCNNFVRRGFFRIFDFGKTFRGVSIMPTSPKEDIYAIMGDWQQVGSDIREG